MTHAGSRTAISFLVVLLSFTVAPVLRSQAPPRDQTSQKKETGIIRGTIVAADTGAALAGIAVRALTEDVAFTGRVPAAAMSDDAGRFEIKDLPPGEYMLYASVGRDRALYVSWGYGAKKFGLPGTPIEVREGSVVEKIVFPVPRAGVVTGRVVNEKGDPMARVSVSALLSSGGGSPHQVDSPRQTDDYGRFRLFGLTPGRYYVKADPEPGAWSGAPDGRNVPRYLPTFYPAALTISEAQSFLVDAGQEISDVEIPVRRSLTYRVSGSVVGRSPGSGRINLAFSRDGRSWVSTSINPDDSFTASNLLPGEYTFVASTFEPGDADLEPEASPPVTVNVDRDVEGVVLTMGRGAKVSGHVTLAIDQGKLPSTLRVVVAAPALGSGLPFARPPTTVVKPDGTFTATRIFGPSIIGVQEAQPSIRQSVTYKGRDITDLPTEFRDSADPRDLEILLTDKGAEIMGRVGDAKGAATRAYILLFSADPKRRGTWAHGFRDMRVDTDGRFSIKPLRAARYLIVALEPGGVGPLDGEMFAKLASIATPVEVVENEVREISLTASKLPQ